MYEGELEEGRQLRRAAQDSNAAVTPALVQLQREEAAPAPQTPCCRQQEACAVLWASHVSHRTWHHRGCRDGARRWKGTEHSMSRAQP